jgi:hypothetical protein
VGFEIGVLFGHTKAPRDLDLAEGSSHASPTEAAKNKKLAELRARLQQNSKLPMHLPLPLRQKSKAHGDVWLS